MYEQLDGGTARLCRVSGTVAAVARRVRCWRARMRAITLLVARVGAMVRVEERRVWLKL